MRLAVLSDVHANSVAMRAVIEDLGSRSVDAVAHLGDIVFRGPDPAGSIELMSSLGPAVWIRGNTDEWYVTGAPDATGPGGYVAFGLSLLSAGQRALLAGLPRTAVITVGEARVLCVHGSPRDQAENVFPDTPLPPIVAEVAEDIVVCGHTHLPFLGRSSGTTVFNVGSVGMPFDGDARATYGVITAAGDDVDLRIVRVRYRVDEAVRLARAAAMPHVDRYEQTLRTGVASF